jgi:hypothetical protein
MQMSFTYTAQLAIHFLNMNRFETQRLWCEQQSPYLWRHGETRNKLETRYKLFILGRKNNQLPKWVLTQLGDQNEIHPVPSDNYRMRPSYDRPSDSGDSNLFRRCSNVLVKCLFICSVSSFASRLGNSSRILPISWFSIWIVTWQNKTITHYVQLSSTAFITVLHHILLFLILCAHLFL